MHALDNPFLDWLGVRLTGWSEDRAEMQLDVASRLGNRSGRVQGGVMCTLLDAVAGYAGLYAPDGEPTKQSVSLSLTTNFVAAGEGRVLVAKGFIDRKGHGIYFARSEVWLDDTLLLATAIGTFKYLRPAAGTA